MSVKNLLYTSVIRLWGLKNVFMIYWLKPKILRLDEQMCQVKIPLTRRSKNHLNSMYISALVTGADVASGLLSLWLVRQKNMNASIVFKDLKADFHKRPEAVTIFTCNEGPQIAHALDQMIEKNQRINHTVTITATCPKKLGNDPVATFKMTLSLKPK